MLTSSAGQQSGGAGAEWEISSGGAVKVTMSNMKPIIGARGGGVQLSGVSTETIQLPQNASATSGAWVESNRDESHQTTAVVGPDGKVLTTITGGVVSGPDGKPIATVGPSPVVAVQGTWTCTPNGLTIEWTSVTNNNNTGSVTVTLARRTP